MLTLHHLNNSRSQRILWLLEELGIEYELKIYQRDAETQLAPPSLKKVHPLGKSPVITDGDKVIAESGAMIEYLCENYGSHLIPEKGSQAFEDYRYWLHYAEGSLMPVLLVKLIFTKIETAPMPFFIRPIAKGISAQIEKAYTRPNILTHMDFIEAHLSQNQWFAGELSAADFQMSFPLEAGLDRIGSYGNYPAIHKYVRAIQARPAYQKALNKGGPYDYTH